ncbi:carboxypeptidase-like regulatory domain-containing protein [Parerythrobacter aestuarii]|uniref:carboxypeptidase-like regulatory domain-containing protein n=1 Tax=Parerythrobacter aestuarii TaxID=3020909 RepID=UPI0024DEEDFE|nr:carboxypeptidase-like regulatory domain-containing protein [Parerythrobacter aestuarii]
MSRQGCNRHCSACDKTIHDLSQLTLDQAEELLKSEDEVCVRAEIADNGMVRLADSGSTTKRKLVAVAGASLSLALAACQTMGSNAVTPLYEISGATNYYEYDAVVTLTDQYGKVRTTKVRRDKSFRFTNLLPGTFTLTITRWCGDPVEETEIVVTEDDVSLGTLKWGENQCIIIGVMTPIGPGRG